MKYKEWMSIFGRHEQQEGHGSGALRPYAKSDKGMIRH